MKAIKDPEQEFYGMNLGAYATDEFQKLLDSAIKKVEPFSVEEEVSRITTYFKVKGEEVSSEYDCCEDDKCIKEAKKEIRKSYGKGTHVEEVWYDNDGDHDNIERCSICEKALNTQLTWIEYELEYIEEDKPWTKEYFKTYAFKILCILENTPSNDRSVRGGNRGNEIQEKELIEREVFFQRVVVLCESINEIMKEKMLFNEIRND